MITRYRLGLQYIGTKYAGFAENLSSANPTVMRLVDDALTKFCGENVSFANLRGSSRTDAGVHAIRNVCQVDLIRASSNLNPASSPGLLNPYEEYSQRLLENEDSMNTFANIPVSTVYDPIYPPESFRKGLNFHLYSHHSHVSITDCSVAHPKFDSRHDAVGRTYLYRIICRNKHFRSTAFPPIPKTAEFEHDRAWIVPFPLNISAMQEAARFFLGEQNFSSLHRRKRGDETSIRHVQQFAVCNATSVPNIYIPPWEYPASFQFQTPDSNIFNSFAPEEEIRIYVRADSFLQRMVRNMVGILVAVGSGKLQVKEVPKLLALKERKKVLIDPAPPQGLYLLNVHFMDDH